MVMLSGHHPAKAPNDFQGGDVRRGNPPSYGSFRERQGESLYENREECGGERVARLRNMRNSSTAAMSVVRRENRT